MMKNKSCIGILTVLLIVLGSAGCSAGTAEPEGEGNAPVKTEAAVAGQTDGEKDTGEEEEPSPENEEAADITGEEKTEEAAAEDAALGEKEYRIITEQLGKTDAVHPAETELLSEMAALVTYSRILDEQGVIFSEMDNYKKARLRRQLLDGVMWEESDFYNAIPVESADGRYNADRIISAEDASALFEEVYGEADFTPTEYEPVEDGYLLFSYGDGDPWELIEHMQFYEDDHYYLLTGPSFYEDNGGSISFMGYADILFRKNPDSRYGVTLLYGRYRHEDIEVSGIETSSALAPAAGKTYTGENLLDGDPATVWSEGVPGTGEGETVTLYLDKKQPVYGVMIVNGYTADYSLYTNNGRLTDVEVDFGGGRVVKGSLEGYGYEGADPEYLADCNRSRMELEEPVMTDKITITVTGAERGAKYDDTCVSEVVVY